MPSTNGRRKPSFKNCTATKVGGGFRYEKVLGCSIPRLWVKPSRDDKQDCITGLLSLCPFLDGREHYFDKAFETNTLMFLADNNELHVVPLAICWKSIPAHSGWKLGPSGSKQRTSDEICDSRKQSVESFEDRSRN
jgi:hypothetical protein